MNLIESLRSELAGLPLREPAEADVLDGVTPGIVAAPRNVEGARELIRVCADRGWSLIPRGGGTQWFVGARPNRFDVLLSTENLTQVFDHDEGNATITAGAGCTLAKLNEVVGRSRQFVPFDASPDATLGGLAATNFSNAWRGRYGMARDLITGLDVVLSDGRELRTGGKVVKNVSGYDLPKLFIGSRGSLGLITRVTVRLRPMDARSVLWSRRYDSLEDLETAVRRVETGPFTPTVFRVVVRPLTKTLYLRFDGTDEALGAQLAELSENEEHSFSAAYPEGVIVVRLALPRALCLGAVRFAEEIGAEEAEWDVESGVVRVVFHNEVERAAVDRLRQKAEAVGGYATLETGPADWKSPETVWGKAPDGVGLMRQVKAKFDPAGVFSPGRFVGGF